MAKGKHGPALYELMGKSKTQEADTRTPAEIARDRARQLDLGGTLWRGKTEVLRQPEPQVETLKSHAPPAKSGLEFVDGRMVASLTHQWAAAALFGVMALLYVGGYFVYQAGKSAGVAQGRNSLQAATESDLESARNGTPTKEDIFAGTGGQSPLLMSNSAETSKPAAGGSDTSTWVAGYTYVCIQDFRASEKDALKSAQEFLKDRGIETEVINRGKGDFPLSPYSRRGFNTKDPIQQDRLKDFWGQIREVGKEYRKAGGKHNLEGYLADYNP